MLLFSIFYLRGDGFNAYSLGYVMGSAIGTLLIPLIFGLIVWFIRGKRKYSGTYTFNIVLTIAVFGMISEAGKANKEVSDSITEITNSVSDYREKIKNEEDAVEAFEEHSASVNENISNVIKNTNGNEQEVYIKLQEFSLLNQKVMIDWQKSYDSILSPRILDFSILNSPNEFDYQISVLKHYHKNSESYKDHFINRVDIVKELLKDIPSNNQTLIGVMKGINKQDSIQKPVVIPFINSHISYGKNLVEVLEFLSKHDGQWTYKDDELNFDTIELEEKYYDLINKAVEDEGLINKLTDKVIEVM